MTQTDSPALGRVPAPAVTGAVLTSGHGTAAATVAPAVVTGILDVEKVFGSVAPVALPGPGTPSDDIVEQWGVQSFPASDPPANW